MMSPSMAMAAVLSPLHAKMSFSGSVTAGSLKHSPSSSTTSDDVATVLSLIGSDVAGGTTGGDHSELQAYVDDAEKGVLSSAVAYRCWGSSWQQHCNDAVVAADVAIGPPRCPLVEVCTAEYCLDPVAQRSFVQYICHQRGHRTRRCCLDWLYCWCCLFSCVNALP